MHYLTELFYFILLLVVLPIIEGEKGSPTLFTLWEHLINWRITLALGDREGDRGEAIFGKCWVYLEEASWRGISLVWHLRHFGCLLREAHMIDVHRRQCFKALRIRILTVNGFALLARGILLSTGHSIPGLDFLFLSLAWCISIAFLGVFSIYYPRSWFWEDDLTEEGSRYLSALFLGRTDGNTAIEMNLQRISQKEVMTGIPLRDSREVLLELWSEKNNIVNHQERKSYEEFLPIGEFFFLGIPSILILLTPCRFLWDAIAS